MKPAVTRAWRRHGQHIYGKYGFFDAFNLSFHFETPHLTFGKVVKGLDIQEHAKVEDKAISFDELMGKTT